MRPKTLLKGVLGTPLLRPIRKHLAGQASILLYHRVLPADAVPVGPYAPHRELIVPLARFEEQISHLARNYRCISLAQAVRELRLGTLAPRSLVVTFDDGYRDTLLHALPVLRKHSVPATVFLATSLIDGELVPGWLEQEAIVRELDRVDLCWNGRQFRHDLGNPGAKHAFFLELATFLRTLSPPSQRECLRLLREQLPPGMSAQVVGCDFLSWEEVSRIAEDPLIELGAHTRNHFVAARLSEEEFIREAGDCRRLIEEKTSRPARFLAYPFGEPPEVGPREFRLAQKCGFEAALTAQIGHLGPSHSRRLFSLPRIPIAHADTVQDLEWKLGGFAFLGRLIDSHVSQLRLARHHG
jgi:peptidoglycan/xylan/chitin deacetylase (PgdA/CDA1 family)